MRKIPVTIGFDSRDIIGMLEYDETKLPKIPNYSFSYACKALAVNDTSITDHELIHLAIIPDYAYYQYLKDKHEQKL